MIVAPALTVPVPTVAPIFIVGVDPVFPVPILISPSLFTCVPKSKSAPASVCKSPILTLRFAVLVALLIVLSVILKFPTTIAVVAVGPILIIWPVVPVVVLPIFKFAVWDSKKLKAVEPEDESIFDEYKVAIVSVPCAVGYDKKCFFPVVAVK